MVRLLRVKKIKRFGVEKVYDITTLTHNFLANNIVVHNSMATPHVAGLLALMYEAHVKLLGKELTVHEIKEMMSKLGHEKNNDSGWGSISWRLYEQWLETQYGVKI